MNGLGQINSLYVCLLKLFLVQCARGALEVGSSEIQDSAHNIDGMRKWQMKTLVVQSMTSQHLGRVISFPH